MILTVTPNPCLHKIVTYHGDADGRRVVRPVESRWIGGGKGVNAARAIKALGGDATALTTFGGVEGKLFVDGLAKEQLRFDGVEVASPTRMSTFVFGADTDELREFLESGAPLSVDERATLQARFSSLLPKAKLVTLNGSVPDETLDDFHAWAVREARLLGKPVIVDTYGHAAVLAEREKPKWWKANLEESAASFRMSLDHEKEILDFARDLRKDGIENVVLTDGARGAWLFTPGGEWRIHPPKVKEVNPVGSGDAMVGAMAMALAKGETALEAVKLGTAAGAANAARVGVCDFAKFDVDALIDDVRVEGE